MSSQLTPDPVWNLSSVSVGKSRRYSDARSPGSRGSSGSSCNSNMPNNMSFTSFMSNKNTTLDGSSSLLKKPKASSFNSPSSPWARRRSFLSPSMINDEQHSVYELSSCFVFDEQAIDDDDDDNNDDIYMNTSPGLRSASFSGEMLRNKDGKRIRRRSHRILSFSLSLKESQGFTWNQDLFASEYQQTRALSSRFNELNKGEDTIESTVEAEDDLLDNSKFKIVHQKRRKSANNPREGYNCVEVSEIIVKSESEN